MNPHIPHVQKDTYIDVILITDSIPKCALTYYCPKSPRTKDVHTHQATLIMFPKKDSPIHQFQFLASTTSSTSLFLLCSLLIPSNVPVLVCCLSFARSLPNFPLGRFARAALSCCDNKSSAYYSSLDLTSTIVKQIGCSCK